jgi:hypothetical protein
MYFAYGWPRAFDVSGSTPQHAPDSSSDTRGGAASNAADGLGATAARSIVQILTDDDFIVVITGSSVQVTPTPAVTALFMHAQHVLSILQNCLQSQSLLSHIAPPRLCRYGQGACTAFAWVPHGAPGMPCGLRAQTSVPSGAPHAVCWP